MQFYDFKGEYCILWSASCDEGDNFYAIGMCYGHSLDNSFKGWDIFARCYGLPIRPVKDKDSLEE